MKIKVPMQTLETLINTTGSSSKGYGQRWEYFANKRPPLPHAICTEPLHPLPSALRHRREVPFGSAQEVTPALGLRRPTAAPASSSSAGLHLNLRRRPSFFVEPPASIFICAAALRVRDEQGRTGGCAQDGMILVKNLSPCMVHEIRLLSKFGNDCRAFVEEAGAVPLLVPLLYSEDAGL